MENKHAFKGFIFFHNTIYRQIISFSQRNKQICDDFLQKLNELYHIETIGVDFLWNYLIFQFEYWKKLDLESRGKAIDISYVYGKRALDRYINRDQNFDWQISERARTYDKKAFEKKVNLQTLIDKDSRYNADDLYREKFFNTDLGLSNCITYTSLFDYASNYCKECIFKDQCIETQKQLYPTIYRNRKIANGSQQTTTR